MKKSFFLIFCFAILMGCSTEQVPEPEPTTELGKFTPYTYSPEFLEGAVESVEQITYWVSEENGEYIQGEIIAFKDRDSLNWSQDFIIYFDSLGMTKKVKYIDETREVTGYYKIDIENAKYARATWFEGDTAISYYVYTYDDTGMKFKLESYNADTDTLRRIRDINLNEQGQWIWLQYSDHMGEAGNIITAEYNDAGLTIANKIVTAAGDFVSEWKFSYNEDGLLSNYQSMGKDSTGYKVEVKYLDFDEKGNYLKTVSIVDGELKAMEVRTIEYY